ncbi:MAG: T9SS type A sorting domain-containing protein [candidate division Zixibacteria bacterium]|nr:T9SS type A sorting domain-containing protein [candidate division Zixibacteria bacterium]
MKRYKTLLVLFLISSLFVLRMWTPSLAEEGHTWEYTINDSRTALSMEERMKHLGLLIPEDAKERFAKLNNQSEPVLLNLDEYFDWREMNGVTPAKDQGQCGSCWDFAATGAFESAILIADSIEWDLSEQQVIDCNWHGQGCSGGWMDTAYELFRMYGAIEESCYPYLANDANECEQDSCVYMVLLEEWEDIQYNTNAIKNALLSGPLSTTLTIPDGFNWNCFDGNWYSPDHAVLIVGWDDNMCDGDGGWIVKNSWGQGWGDNGFFYIPYNSCGIGHYTQRPIYISRLPEITCNPETIEFNVPSQGTTEEILQIGNVGEGDLYYRLRPMPPTNQDSFGYYWFDSGHENGPGYEWIDITDVGQPVDFRDGSDNSNSGHIDLGFDFNYYNSTYGSACICTNGWISFTDSTSTTSFNQPIPATYTPDNIIAPFWTNLAPSYGGDIYFYSNNSDTVIISWEQVPDSWDEGTFTFQVILNPPSTITFQYHSMGPEGRIDRASIGMENQTGTVGLQVSRNEVYTYGEKAVQFNLGPPAGLFDWLSVDEDNGMAQPAEFDDLMILCDAGDRQSGVYWAYIDVYSNDPNSIHTKIPVTMNVGQTDVDSPTVVAKGWSLKQNYPNPFNATTKIWYSLPARADVKLQVYNILGQHIATLVDGMQNAGEYSVRWDASGYSSGIYYYSLTTGAKNHTRKMILLK